MMIATNVREVQLVGKLYNDNLMGFFVILCLYFLQKKRPMTAATMLTLGISIKAGAILALPGLLVCLARNFKIKILLPCLFLIISVQVLVALPFTNNKVAGFLGYK